jgi:DNA adenine methylase
MDFMYKQVNINNMKPFLKWVGGKSQILESVLQSFPTEINNYHEPFVGGGSILLGILSSERIHIRGKIYASDLNSSLIGLYKNIQNRLDDFIQEVNSIVSEFAKCKNSEINRKATTLEEALTSPESYYFWIRSRFNSLSAEEKQTPKGSALFLFMNKTCFRGLYREGPNGFNVPYGNYKHPTILDEEHIRQISARLQSVVFTCCSFTESLKRISEGDFVYLDPPYAPETTSSFVSYTYDGFAIEQHETLFKMCKELPCKFLMSNADVQLVKDAFPPPKYNTKIVLCRRAINSRNPESVVNEVFITN